MDIRTYRYLPHQALARVNARHPWNHNDYFHGWILRNLPAGRDLAVDIGCGLRRTAPRTFLARPVQGVQRVLVPRAGGWAHTRQTPGRGVSADEGIAAG
jgi:hypothetical protein